MAIEANAHAPGHLLVEIAEERQGSVVVTVDWLCCVRLSSH
jgi:hypothetical protein